jgi:hypothetical protein
MAGTVEPEVARASTSSRRSIHNGTTSLLFMTENRQFHSFIIITMILIVTHDSAIRREEVLGAGWIAE